MSWIKRNKPQLLFYIIFAVIPLILWLTQVQYNAILTSFYSIVTFVAKGFGIAGIGMFAGNLILSGRYHFLDKLFGGLDKLYLFHGDNGKRTFYLLTGHALIMALRPMIFSFDSFIAFNLNFQNMAVNYGKIAYTGLLVIIIITLYLSKKFEYEKLKFIHMFMGAFFFFGGLHAFFIPSDIARNMPLRYYVLGIASIALLSWLVRTVFKRWLVSRSKYEVVEVNNLGGNVTEIVMKPKSKPIKSYYPGQFMFVRYKQVGFPYEDHPFSITSSPHNNELRMSAKAIGDFTTEDLPRLKPGAEAHVQGAYGSFSYQFSKRKKHIWIAGGIGITPFISMVRTIRQKGIGDQVITLVHTGQTENDLIYKKEFEAIAEQYQSFTFVPWVTDKQGFLTIDEIVKHADIKDTSIYICGPQKLMLLFSAELEKRGVSPEDIHYELFRLL